MRCFSLVLIIVLSINIAFAQNEQTPSTSLKERVKLMEKTFKETLNTEQGLKTSQAVLDIAEPNTKTYFEALFHLGYWQIWSLEAEAAAHTLSTMKTTLEANKSNSLEVYWLYWYYLKSLYATEIENNVEKALAHSVYGFFEAANHPKILTLLSQQAAIAMGKTGQYDTGEMLLKVYKLSNKLSFQNDLEKGKFYTELGRAYYFLENWEVAKETLETAAKILEPYKEEVPNVRGIALHHLAYCPPTNLKIREQLFNEGYRHYLFDGALAKLYYQKYEDEKALPLIQNAITQIVPEYQPQSMFDVPQIGMLCKDPKTMVSLSYTQSFNFIGLAENQIALGDTSTAIQLLQSSIEAGLYGYDVNRKMVEKMVGYQIGIWIGNEHAIANLSVALRAAFGLYQITQSPDDLNVFYGLMEKKKCLTVYQELEPSPLPIHLTEKLKKYVQQIEIYEVQFSSSPEKGYRQFFKDFMDVNLEFEEFQKTLYQQPKVLINHNDVEFLSIEAIQENLNEDEVLIEYSIYTWTILGIAITKNDVYPALLRDEDHFEKKTIAYRESLNNRFNVQTAMRNDFIDKSHELYNILIKPFEQIIKDKQRLIIIPERELLSIPFETLLKTADKKPFHELDFLIKNYEINYRYSATIHEKIQKRKAINDFSTLTFAPIFENSTATSDDNRSLDLYESSTYNIIENNAFVHLPFSKKEVETIETINGQANTTALIGQNATKIQLQKQLQQPFHFVHIATHSMVHYNDPRLSAIACYKSGNIGNLYFSYEFVQQPIRADMLILSSCESGVGRIIEGEGLIGLNRSVLIAGARNTIFSLWKVEDKHSCDLMIDFYKSYQENQDYTTALHQAKLKMLENPIGANPRFWAAFVLIGE